MRPQVTALVVAISLFQTGMTFVSLLSPATTSTWKLVLAVLDVVLPLLAAFWAGRLVQLASGRPRSGTLAGGMLLAVATAVTAVAVRAAMPHLPVFQHAPLAAQRAYLSPAPWFLSTAAAVIFQGGVGLVMGWLGTRSVPHPR